MILQELCNLYNRLKDDSAYEIPQRGFSIQKNSFIVVLNEDGTLFDIQDARVPSGKKMISREMLVPGTTKPSGSGLNPCVLWDNPSYLLGYFEAKNPQSPTAEDQEKILRAPKAFEKSREVHLSLLEKIPVREFQIVGNFFRQWKPENLTSQLKEKLKTFSSTGFGVFQIRGESCFVHEIPEVVAALVSAQASASPDENTKDGVCLISGERSKIADLHAPAIKGVPGAQSSGAKLVSFNWNAATSYGKEGGMNAPVSEESANQYCVALNALLGNASHRLRIGDATVVFWTGAKTAIEGDLSKMFELADDAKGSAQDVAKLARVQSFLKNLRDAGTPQTALAGDYAGDDAGTSFFMLGLSPNAARLAVRFWHAGTLGKFLENLREHHRAMRIQRRHSKFNDPEFVPLWLILRQTARDADGIPPLMGGALLRAVIENLPYPVSLIRLIINRIRIEGRIDYVRASVLKAFLTRNKKQKITMSLDKSNTTPAYLLGRLFAVLEKAQTEAIKDANSTIRERFYASASAAPRAVFPIMLRTFPHWIAKLEKRREIFFSKLVQEIINGVNSNAGFPSHLNLEAQGLFAIGYYQQMQDFFQRNDVAGDSDPTDTPEASSEK